MSHNDPYINVNDYLLLLLLASPMYREENWSSEIRKFASRSDN